MSTNPLLAGLPLTHPGEILRAVVIPATGKRQAEVAQLPRVPTEALAALIEERAPVTAAMALRLGKLFGHGPEFWMNLQAEYDLAQAKEELGTALDQIPTLNRV